MLDFLLRPISKLTAIPILGIGMGIPFQIMGVTTAALWKRKNNDRLLPAKSVEYESLKRKTMKLKTGITYDFYETKNMPDTCQKTAVFLHGFPDTAASWTYYMDEFSKNGFHCLAPNQRGYAKSSKPTKRSDYDIDLLAADIHALIEEKVPNNRKVTLVIHDWGSAVGFHFARNYPHLVDKIIAVNGPSLEGMGKNYRNNPKQILASYYMCFFQLPWIPEFFLKAFDFSLYCLIMGAMGTPLKEVRTTLMEFGGTESLTSAINWYRGNYGRLVDSVFDEEPKKIEHDVLMLWGDKDRALTPKTPEIESTFISGKVEIIRFPNGGHNLHMQERESVSKEMKKFLKID